MKRTQQCPKCSCREIVRLSHVLDAADWSGAGGSPDPARREGQQPVRRHLGVVVRRPSSGGLWRQVGGQPVAQTEAFVCTACGLVEEHVIGVASIPWEEVAGATRLRSWEVSIEPATVADAAELLALQKHAYRSEAEIYADDTIPPLTQTLAELEQAIASQVVLEATSGGQIVGSVRAFERDGSCHIGRLVVHPTYQGRGLGQRLMAAIEGHFALARRYELFTGDRSERNLHLYQKLGYRPFRREVRKGQGTTYEIVFLEKPGPAGRS